MTQQNLNTQNIVLLFHLNSIKKSLDYLVICCQQQTEKICNKR